MIVLKLARALLEELSHGTALGTVPLGHCNDKTNQSRDETGTCGTLGTGSKPQAAINITDRSSRSASDILEVSAMISDGDRCSPHEADRRALAYAGFANFTELARHEEVQVLAALDRLPAPNSALGARLHDCTLLFVRSPSFAKAISLGWTTDELFAIGSAHDTESMGPIPAWALFHWPAFLVAITESEVCFRKPSGKAIQLQRFRTGLEDSKAWWNSDEIILWH